MYTGTFGPVSNRAAWSEEISLLETSSSTPPALTEAVLTFGGGKASKVTKKLSESDLSYDDDEGVLSFTLSDDTMRAFCAGTYDMGIVITIAGVDTQLFAGELQIVDGVVP